MKIINNKRLNTNSYKLAKNNLIDLLQNNSNSINDIPKFVDYLFDYGVVMPPVDIGQKVWYRVNDDYHIIETEVEKIIITDTGLKVKLACNAMYESSLNNIGKTIFLTKPEDM